MYTNNYRMHCGILYQVVQHATFKRLASSDKALSFLSSTLNTTSKEAMASPDPLFGYIELTSADGSKTTKLTADTPDVGGNYTKAKIKNSDPRTIWILYDGTDYTSPNFEHHDGAKVVKVNDHQVDYGRTIKSARGFNAYKPGIILFEHFDYRGPTVGPLKESTPSITGILVSSVIVSGGVWGLFTEENYQGTQLEYNGDKTFGVGEYVLTGRPNDRTKSVKILNA